MGSVGAKIACVRAFVGKELEDGSVGCRDGVAAERSCVRESESVSVFVRVYACE